MFTCGPLSLFAFQNQTPFPQKQVALSIAEDVLRFEYEFSKELKIDLNDLNPNESYTADFNIIYGDINAYVISGNNTILKSKLGVFELNNSKSAEIFFQNKGKGKAKIVLSVIKQQAIQLSSKMMSVLTVDDTPTPDFLVEDVFIGGDCYDVSQVEFTGHNLSKGSFANGLTNIGFTDGVILGSGHISNAPGPNTVTNITTQTYTSGDNDLKILANNAPVYDASVLEFDFVPTTDTIKFRYVFASEEYCDYSNSSYNDVFGFFLSGPGISGPYSNNSINIATLPTGQNVTINNVNHINNPEYYVSNTTDATNTGSKCVGNPLGSEPGISELQYDAHTVILEACAIVQPCQPYHIKLAVADVYDRKFDSAVFLESNSFVSGEQIEATVENSTTGESSGFEDCDLAMYEFCRTAGSSNSEPIIVSYSLDANSTATPAVDFEAFPMTVTIPAGTDCISLPIQLYNDGLDEGDETIILNLDQSCSCLNNSLTFSIKDKTAMNVSVNNSEICPGESTTLTADALGGAVGYTYYWNTGETTKSIDVSPVETSDYMVTVTDNCGETAEKVATVTVAELPEAVLSGSGSICSDQSNTVDLDLELLGEGPWVLTYTIDGVEQPAVTTSDSSYTLSVSEPGIYTLSSVVEEGKVCFGSVSGSVSVGNITLLADVSVTDPNCFGASTGSIAVSMAGGDSPYVYNWSDASASGNAPANLSAGTYEVTITDDNGCQSIQSETLTEPDEITAQLSNVNHIDCNNPNGTALVTASGGANNGFTYLWSTGSIDTLLSVTSAGSYDVTITDENACTTEETVVIVIDTAAVVDLTVDEFEVDCNNPSVQFTGLEVNTSATLDYQWSTTDGQITSGSNEINPIVSSAGTYVLEVYNTSNGCTHEAEVFVEEDFAIPVANAGLDQMLNCTVTALNLDASASDSGTIFAYDWTTIDGNIVSGSESLNPLIDDPGTYEVLVTNQNSGCTNTASVLVSEDVETPDFSIQADIEVLTCDHTSTTLSYILNGDPANHSMVWTDESNNPVMSGSVPGVIDINTPGNYTLLFTDNTNGCFSEEQIVIEEDIEDPVSLVLGSGSLNCSNQTVTIDGTGSSEGAEFTYQWQDPTGAFIIGETSLSISVEETGSYALVVTNNSNGCTSVSEELVEIDTLIPDVNLVVNDQLDCSITEVQLIGNVTNANAPLFEWLDQDGLPINSDASNIMVSEPGLYTVQVENETNGCTSSATVIVEQDVNIPEVSAEPVEELNCLNTSRILSLVNQSSDQDFEYDWTTSDGNILSGAASSTPIVDAAGTYTVLVSNTDNGCSASISVELGENITSPEILIADTDLLTCEVGSIEIDATSSSNGSNFIYSWTTSDGSLVSGSDTPTPMVDAAGTYTLLITDLENGCTDESDVSVDQDIDMPVAIVSNIQELNCDLVTFDLDGLASEGLNLVYEWKDANTQEFLSDEEYLTVNEAGFYTLLVNNTINGCEHEVTVEVIENIIEPFAELSVTNLLTCTQNEATINSSVVANSGSFDLQWINTTGEVIDGQTAEFIQVDETGSYTLQVEDTENGCLTSVDVQVEEDVEIPAVDIFPPAKLTCVIEEITLTGSIGSTDNDVSIIWTTDTGNIIGDPTVEVVDVNVPSIYYVEVTDISSGCKNTVSVMVEENTETPLSQVQASGDLNCVSHNVQLNGAGVGVDLAFSWKDPNTMIIPGADTEVLTVHEAGAYTFVVLDQENGCFSESIVTVEVDTVSPNLDVDTPDVLNCIQTSVSISGSSTNVEEPIYSWFGPQGLITAATGTSVEVESPGTYLWVVSNQVNGCVNEKEIIISQDIQMPQLTISSTGDLTCLNTEQTIELMNESSDPIFEYSWTTSNGSILSGDESQNPVVNAPGIYNVEVLNLINGCTESIATELQQDIDSPDIFIEDAEMLTCLVNSVELNAAASSSGGIFNYLWTTSDGEFVSGVNTATPVVSTGGNYLLTITNLSNGCFSELNIEVQQDEQVPVAVVSNLQELTCDLTAFELSGDLSEGDNLQYLWKDSSTGQLLSVTADVIVSQAGLYTLEVVDVLNGCSHETAVVVQENILAPVTELDVVDILTCMQEVSTINSSISTNSGLYDVVWIDEAGSIIDGQNASSIEVSASGIYTLQVEDPANGCTSEAFAIVESDFEIPSVSVDQPATINCIQDEVSLNATIGNSDNDVAILWTTSTGNIQSDPILNQVSVNEVGDYIIAVTDLSSGCISELLVTVDGDLNAPVAEISGNEILTCSLDEIELSANNSQGTDLTYEWWSGSTGLLLSESSNLSTSDAGNYTLIVVNQINGCSDNLDFIVEENILSPELDALDVDILTCLNTEVVLEAQISTVNAGSPVNCVWSMNGSILQAGNQDNYGVNTPGIYHLLVEDLDNGCIAEIDFQVDEDITAPTVFAAEPANIDCDTDEVQLDVTVLGVSGGSFSFDWSYANGTLLDPENLDVTVTAAGNYELTVVNSSNGCPTFIELTVQEDYDYPIVDAGLDFMFPCFEESVSLDAFIQVATAEYSIDWSTVDGNIVSGNSSINPEISSDGLYIITVENEMNGCVAQDEIRVEKEQPYPIDIDNNQPPCHDDPGSITITSVSLASGPFIYSIDGGDSFSPESNFQYLNAGSYEVVVQDLNGCWSEIKDVELINPVKLNVDTEVEIFIEQGEVCQLYTTVNYSLNEINSVIWTPSEGLDCSDCLNPVFEGSSTQTYEVEVETVNGCVERSVVTIYVDETPKVYIPNAFTPDGEGSNDIFFITADPETVDLIRKFEIYDRWGEKMICYEYFKPNDPNYGWDGVFRGRLCNPGVFIYLAEVIMKDGRVEKFTGDVTISN